MVIYGDIVIKYESGLSPVFFDCGSIVFLGMPGTTTINLYPLINREYFQFENIIPLELCLSFCNFDLVILSVLLTLGKQKGLPFKRHQDYGCNQNVST